MLIVGLVGGLLAGLVAGGRLDHLASVRLRWMAVLFGGLVLRFAVGWAIDNRLPLVGELRLPLYAFAFGLVLAGLWANRAYPGLSLAFVGVASNLVAVVANGGFMPVWFPSLLAAGFPANEPISSFHVVLPQVADVQFLVRAGPFGDIIPIPLPFLRNVASVGDLFLASGLAFFLFATLVRTPSELDEEAEARIAQRLASMRAGLGPATFAGTDLLPGLAEAAALDRPLILGGGAAGLAAPGRRVVVVYIPPIGPPPIVERLRRHPYVRLALDGSFSALWLGQLISLFGDRIHLIALTFLVLGETNSAIAVSLVFVVATVPNLILGPIAGTLVDRWDHREVMIVSDLLRAGLVLLIPVAATINLVFVYPLVFLVTTVSIFFRPAKGAIVPRLVKDEDLLPANSAMWVGETLADIVGYALAGIFVAFLGTQLTLAFWIDAVTYIASALLLATIVVAPAARAAARAVVDAAAGAAERAASAASSLWSQVKDGWRFLRGERLLLANTAQAAVAQFMFGVFIVLTPIYASEVVQGGTLDDTEVFSFLEAAIGAGNLVGGFLVGLIGARLSLGRLVIVGYAITGACVAALALTGNLGAALALMFGAGAGNLVFVIPSQTLFHRRTPAELMARVLSFRSSLVFGSMTIAMAAGGVLGEAFGAAVVLGAFGLLTVVAGLAGLLVPAVRDA